MGRINFYFVSLLLFIILGGCASVDRSSDGFDPNNLHEIVDLGDLIRIKTLDNEQHRFRVDTITKDVVGGRGVEIKTTDIDTITFEESNEVYQVFRTTGKVVNVVWWARLFNFIF